MLIIKKTTQKIGSHALDQYSNYTDQVADKEIRVNGINTQGNYYN